MAQANPNNPLICPSVINGTTELHYVSAYGRYRRQLSKSTDEEFGDDATIEDDWHTGHDDFDTNKH
jgi:hypothetical protein